MSAYEDLQKQQARRWAAEVVASLAKGETQPTEQDRRDGAELDRMEARARAVHAQRILQADGLDDPDRWVKAPKQPGEWHMQEYEVQDVDRWGRTYTTTEQDWWKEHPEKVEVPDPYLAWVARGETTYDPGHTSHKLAPLREPDLLDEWAQPDVDDYQGGPVAWDDHTDHYDLTA